MPFIKREVVDNARGILGDGISDTDTSIPLSLQQNLPTGNAILTLMVKDVNGDVAKMEKVKLLSRTGNTLTVERGFEGTTQQSFDQGDRIVLMIVASHIKDIQDQVATITGNYVTTDTVQTITGAKTFTKRIFTTENGTASAPALAIGNGTQGLFDSGVNKLGVSVGNGTHALDISPGYLDILGGASPTIIYRPTSGTYWRTRVYSDKYQLIRSATILETILNNGNHGFGIDSPSAKVHIKNTSSIEAMRVESTATNKTVIESFASGVFTGSGYDSAHRFSITNPSSTGVNFEMRNEGTGINQYIKQYGNGTAIYIKSFATTARGIDLDMDSITSGSALYLSSSSDGLTGGGGGKGLAYIVGSGNIASNGVPILKLEASHATNKATCLGLRNTGQGCHINMSGDPSNAVPQDGDFWFDGTDLKLRVGGTTYTIDKT